MTRTAKIALGLTACLILLLSLRHFAAGNPAEAAAAPMTGVPVGLPVEGFPMITDISRCDLDQDGLVDLLICDAKSNRVTWLRQVKSGEFEETVLTSRVAAPVRATAVDLDQDGDQDVVVCSMGVVPPTIARIGRLVVLGNTPAGFGERVILDHEDRVSDAQPADLDGDGDIDLSLAQFGYQDGSMGWLENRGEWNFTRHDLLALSGTIHAPTSDMDGDGDIDLVAIVSQEWEELYLLENQGGGVFTPKVIWGAVNEDFGSSGIHLADLDQDGDQDIVYTNGDGFDYAMPGPRPWHGVQWLENDGKGNFEYHRIGDLPGAYTPRAADYDGDGDLDLIVVCAFNDWTRVNPESLVCYEQVGKGHFIERVLASTPTNLLALETVDLDRDGISELFTGGLHLIPTGAQPSRLLLWKR